MRMSLAGFRESMVAACAPLLIVGCGGSQRAAKASHVGVTNMQPSEPAVEVLQEASSLGIVEISDEIRRACRIDDPDAYFALDFQALRGDQGLPGLNKVAACFISGPLAGRTMKLVGHSDPQGTREYNKMLGQARADSVARYFDGHGLTKARLKTISRGAMDATSADEGTRPRERGVDIVLGP